MYRKQRDTDLSCSFNRTFLFIYVDKQCILYYNVNIEFVRYMEQCV